MTHSDSSTVLTDVVVCTLVNPTPGRLDPQGARLELHLAHPGSDDTHIHSAELILPTGARDGSVTTTPDTLRIGQSATTPVGGHTQAPVSWTLAHRGEGHFDLKPAGPVPLNTGTPLILTLYGLTPVPGPATATLTTRIELGDSRAPARRSTTCHRLSWTDEEWINSFSVDRTLYTKNDKVTLTWTGMPASQTGTEEQPEYFLYYTLGTPGHQADGRTELLKSIDVIASGYMDTEGHGACVFTGIDRTTAFMLQASRTDSGVLSTQTASAVAVIDKPDLTVGRLACSGTVALMGQSQTLLPRTTSSGPFHGNYKPTTDGMLHVTMECQHKDEPVNLAVTVDDTAGNKPLWTLDACTHEPDAPENILVPLPAGTHIYVVVSSNDEFTAQVTWYPLGQGQLNPTTPA
ncbi:hypothetical protein [Streptomyces sp. NPDC053720]|uniref:hypothetical protein n=1 Tax=Streptomyces sp. NPDC053720 TaxID=3154855 RepID=UPI00341618CD